MKVRFSRVIRNNVFMRLSSKWPLPEALTIFVRLRNAEKYINVFNALVLHLTKLENYL